MCASDELERLGRLHERGVLTGEEFARAKQRVLDGTACPAAAPAPAVAAMNALRRSVTDRWLGGVCGGIAEITGVASWLWRVAFVVLAMFGGTGVLAYLLLWVMLPQEEPFRAGPPAGQHGAR